MVLRLGCSDRSKSALDLATVAALHTAFRAKGTTYAFTDSIDNAFTVVILDFTPVPFLRAQPAGGGSYVTLFAYTMELQVVACTRLLGASYSE